MSATVLVLAFAGARDVIGAHEVELELPESPCSAAKVLELLYERYPALAPFRAALRLAVNGSYADMEESVKGGDEVALIPPVAGG